MSFKDDDSWESHKQYYLPTVEKKSYNVMIDGRKFFDKPIKNLMIFIWFILNWMFIRLSLFQRMLPIDCNWFKQTTKNRCWSKGTVLDFSKGTIKVLWFYFV